MPETAPKATKPKKAASAKPKKPSTKKLVLDAVKLETGGKASKAVSRQKIAKIVGGEKTFLITRAIKGLVKAGDLAQDKGSFRLAKKEVKPKAAKKAKSPKKPAAKKPKPAAKKASPKKKPAAKPAAKKATTPKKPKKAAKPAAKKASTPKKPAKKTSPKKKPAPKK